MMILAVALGGAIGSVCRYLLGLAIQNRVGGDFPLGTLIINISGSFALGFLLRYALLGTDINPVMRVMLTTGLVGGYTTFSTFSYETASLIEDGWYGRASLYVGLSIVVSLVGTFLGFHLARTLFTMRE